MTKKIICIKNGSVVEHQCQSFSCPCFSKQLLLVLPAKSLHARALFQFKCQAVPKGGAPARERSLACQTFCLWGIEIIRLPRSSLLFVTNPGEQFINVC